MNIGKLIVVVTVLCSVVSLLAVGAAVGFDPFVNWNLRHSQPALDRNVGGLVHQGRVHYDGLDLGR